MKILQIGKFYFPDRGGMETVVKNLAEGLYAMGHHSEVLCYAPGPHDSKEVIENIPVTRVGHHGHIFSQPLAFSLPSQIWAQKGKFDIFNFHAPNPLSELAMFAMQNKMPYVVTYHSDIVRQKLLLPFYAPFLHRFLSGARKIIVATEKHIEHSPFLTRYRGRCEVVPFGIDPHEYVLTDSVQVHIQKLQKNYGNYLLFVGRLVPYKGLSTLIQAMKLVTEIYPDLKLIVVGSGPLEKALKKEVQEHQLEKNIFLKGSIENKDEMTALFHGCSIHILPSISRNEAFGMVQLEAMACGKPSIVSRLDSGITMIQDEGLTGLFSNPGDAHDLAKNIINLYGDPYLREKMGVAALGKFQSHFTREKMAQAYFNIYAATSQAS